MIIYQVTEDLGDGDVAIRNFRNRDNAVRYMEENEDYTYHESNPNELDTDNIHYMED